jgi:hypothetical protein
VLNNVSNVLQMTNGDGAWDLRIIPNKVQMGNI